MSTPPSFTSPPVGPSRRPPPTWRELHPGDDPAVEALQFAGWAAASPAEKMAQLAGLMRLAHRLANQGRVLRNAVAAPDALEHTVDSVSAAATGTADAVR